MAKDEVATVLDLRDPAAVDPDVAGAKAANLARASQAGLPVLPGFVLAVGVGGEPLGGAADVVVSWAGLSASGDRALAVRSSSTTEDQASSSMAGMFHSVLDVRGWQPFADAVEEVRRSGEVVAGDRSRMAVLVQPFLQPAKGGVLFGADPLTGDRNRMVVAAVRGGPHRLVSGEVDGSRWTLSRRGRLVGHDAGTEGPDLSGGERRALAALSRRAEKLFGGPQDIEWAIDDGGSLWLLQSRPITAVGTSTKGRGPIFGPGPVAETFPEPLSPLEQDIWLQPLRDGLAEALALAGAASRSQLQRSPVVTAVGGRAAADLALLGLTRPRSALLHRLDPRGPFRHLLAAWQVGRLRRALPELAHDIISQVDSQLADVPALGTLSDAELLAVLENSRQALVALHGHEVLVGLLLKGTTATTGASVALRAVVAARSQGMSDEEIVAEHPIALVLTPPAVRATTPLPDVPPSLPPSSGTDEGDALGLLRETLRARARWVQELGARGAWLLGDRLSDRGVLVQPDDVRLLTLPELRAVVRTSDLPVGLDERRRVNPAPPLPASFRLGPGGVPIPIREPRRAKAGAPLGVAAGGGRVTGPVHGGDGTPAPGSVLVVPTLDPHLASVLPGLAAVVAETGSPLSHLAILARELGVAVVVGVAGAVRRFPSGTLLLVDGSTGEVEPVRDPSQKEASP